MSDGTRIQDESIQVREPNSPDDSHPGSTIVIGLGNPILGDDGVGWHVAEQVANRLSTQPGIDNQIIVERLSLGGLSLMENLIGYKRAILVDAINLGQAPQGSIYVIPLNELPDHARGHLSSSHDTSLQNALGLGSSIGAELPEKIEIVGIESPFVYDFSEELTPPVAAAVPKAVQKVLELLDMDNYKHPSEE